MRKSLNKLNLNKPEDFWTNVLWINEPKVEIVGRNKCLCLATRKHSISGQTNTSYEHLSTLVEGW